jgi:hypothetical protein
MSEPVRPEHAERVRDFYRKQGRDAEFKSILDVLNLKFQEFSDAGDAYASSVLKDAIIAVEKVRSNNV